MNRGIAHAVIGVLLLASPWAALAGEINFYPATFGLDRPADPKETGKPTSMTHDDTVNPGAPPPRIAPPGGGNALRPLSPNITPSTPRNKPATPAGAAGAAGGPNCGTHWTNWTKDPQTNVNPCPPGCVRGERQLVKTHKQGDTILYDARYQCYGTATRTPPPKPKDGKVR